MNSGSVQVDKKDRVIFSRLYKVFKAYKSITDLGIDEVHIEQLVRNTHIYTHWSVAVIGLALYLQCANVDGDIPIKSWQKYVEWEKVKDPKGIKVGKKLGAYQEKVGSEDELAAIGMGLWYLEHKT